MDPLGFETVAEVAQVVTTSWLDLLAAAAGGGLFVKLLDIGFAEYRRRSEARASAKEIVARHLDPILKAADQLVGKMRYLAETDFDEIKAAHRLGGGTRSIEVGNVLYLFAQFWVRIEIFHKESLYVEVAADETGARLRDFLRCLESKPVRVVDRPRQRAIGEGLMVESGRGLDCVTFPRFLAMWSDGEGEMIDEWLGPLHQTIYQTVEGSRATRARMRQQLLLYGVIVHALIDTLDPKHRTSNERPSYANKLSQKSLRELRHRLFKLYLPFVKRTGKYTFTQRGVAPNK